MPAATSVGTRMPGVSRPSSTATGPMRAALASILFRLFSLKWMRGPILRTSARPPVRARKYRIVQPIADAGMTAL